MMRWILPIVFLLVSATQSFCDPTKTLPPPLKIGAILPLTGNSQIWGITAHRGINMAVAELGQDALLQIHFEDDRCSPKDAVSAYQRLKMIQVEVIVGPICSSATLAVAPLAERDQIPLISFSEADSISQAGENIFRLWVPNGRQGRTLARLILASGARNLAILTIENAFGLELSTSVRNEFVRLGGSVIEEIHYQPEEQDFRSALIRIRGSKADAISVASYVTDGITVMKRIRELSLTIPLYFSSTINTPIFLEALGPAAAGVRFADLRDTTAENFKLRWHARYDEKFPGLSTGAPLFYDVINILQRFTADIRPRSAKKLREYLNDLAPYQGASGPIKFDAHGDLDREHVIYSINDRKAEAG